MFISEIDTNPSTLEFSQLVFLLHTGGLEYTKKISSLPSGKILRAYLILKNLQKDIGLAKGKARILPKKGLSKQDKGKSLQLFKSSSLKWTVSALGTETKL